MLEVRLIKNTHSYTLHNRVCKDSTTPLRIVASGVNKLKRPDNSTIVITHYQRLLDYIVPDVVHVLYDGRIVKTAGKELVLELEKYGYDWIKQEVESGK